MATTADHPRQPRCAAGHRRASRLRRAYPGLRSIAPGVYRAGPRSTRVIAVRRGRVRLLAVAARGLLREPAALRRHLRRAGLLGQGRTRGQPPGPLADEALDAPAAQHPVEPVAVELRLAVGAEPLDEEVGGGPLDLALVRALEQYLGPGRAGALVVGTGEPAHLAFDVDDEVVARRTVRVAPQVELGAVAGRKGGRETATVPAVPSSETTVAPSRVRITTGSRIQCDIRAS